MASILLSTGTHGDGLPDSDNDSDVFERDPAMDADHAEPGSHDNGRGSKTGGEYANPVDVNPFAGSPRAVLRAVDQLTRLDSHQWPWWQLFIPSLPCNAMPSGAHTPC